MATKKRDPLSLSTVIRDGATSARVESTPPGVQPDSEAELAEAISELADQAARSITTTRRVMVVALVCVAVTSALNLGAARNVHVVVGEATEGLTGFVAMLEDWRTEAEAAARRDVNTHRKIDTSIAVNRDVARAVGALIESQTTKDKTVAKAERRAASNAAVVARARAAKSAIDSAKSKRKAPPKAAERELQLMQKVADERKLDTKF
jgi:hypothetical protein